MMAARGRWTVVTVIFVTFVLGFGPGLIHRQILGLGATDIHWAATLPDQIGVCGRDWTKGQSGHQYSRSEILATWGVEPSLVDPLPFPPCPRGPCTTIAQNGPCDTVVFVRVGEDAYLPYELQGGP
jgi:hypothetical protein